MNTIEVLICLILLLMAVPDWCRKLRRPALAYSVFILFGVALEPLVDARLENLLEQAGQLGFVLLLFGVGLEIELPAWRQFFGAARFAFFWALFQYPVILAVALIAGLEVPQALLAAAALTGCSVGMAHPAWQSFPSRQPDKKAGLLHRLVALEIMAIVLMAVHAKVLEQGVTWWILLRLLGILLVIYLITRFARHLMPLFKRIIETTTHWRMHWLVLLIFAVCALGQRLGLDSAKTAFFLGLALSRARHHNVPLAEVIAPISQRFLIPIFFVSLGLTIHWRMLLGWPALLALGGAGLLLALRRFMHQSWWNTGVGHDAFLLFCPNLTMVALAAKISLQHPATAPHVPWLLLTGLFLTVFSIFALPKEKLPESPPSGA